MPQPYIRSRTNPRTPASPHWTDGGTGITNFDTKDLPIYEEALKASGMTDVLYVELRPMAGGGETCDFYSLHFIRGVQYVKHLSGKCQDLSTFWKFHALATKLHEMRLGYIESLTKANRALTQAVRDQDELGAKYNKALEIIESYQGLCSDMLVRMR